MKKIGKARKRFCCTLPIRHKSQINIAILTGNGNVFFLKGIGVLCGEKKCPAPWCEANSQ
jgi:hypothetical protein